jgi:hypothetical protein
MTSFIYYKIIWWGRCPPEVQPAKILEGRSVLRPFYL